ncbi:arginine repressor [Lacticaseibacillus camelliae]|uniref:Arginine repressor n=1 Tax=Lacticaseibacillus camelliae DSM 22697 = JCM 13995 TaxID=1423730 RepID=A0A0R2F8W4_9LACO|nr:ArgR family transcriptional regulator [Lacticaseibacillus camelliae]KRN24783.1 arginine repressor [Lacticaseibacillus camelliae DSM 22697 = JCM 13995]
MQKNERQAQIRALVESTPIERQGDFVAALAGRGIKVTQATISRDIKEMQLVKVPMTNGHYRYSLPPERQLAPQDKLRRTLQAAYLRGDVMDQFVYLVMSPGTAPAVGSLIERLDDARIFATIAGDASILLVCRGAAEAKLVLKMLDEMV